MIDMDYSLTSNPGLISDRKFWTEAWNAAIAKGHALRRRSDTNVFEYWGKMADIFEQISRQDRLKNRINKTLHLLDKEGINLKEAKVLDIGCGIGDFSLAFAGKGAEVTALEPATPLLARLTEKTSEEKTFKIKTLAKEWNQANLEGDIKKRAFHLTFSSLNPGLRDPQTIEAMIRSSSSYCLLCDIGPGGGRSPSKTALWEKIFSEQMPSTLYNIIYPLGYLISSGYQPSLETWTENWGETLPLDKAVANAVDFFSLYLKPNRALQHSIEDYFELNSVNGIYSEEYPVRMGMILWKV